MKVLLRTTADTMMAVGANAADAIYIVLGLPEFRDFDILEVSAKPLGGEETRRMTADFVRETGTYIPGFTEGEKQRIYMVTISAQLMVEWSQQQQQQPQLRRDEKDPGDTLVGDGTGVGDRIDAEFSQEVTFPVDPRVEST